MSEGAAEGGSEADADTPVSVQVRGIYTTALTHLFESGDGTRVVRASEPIRDRFESEFAVHPEDAVVATTEDRQGVGVTGAPAGVAALDDHLRVGLDTLAWDDPAPEGAVFDGVVTDTLGSGAVLELVENRDVEGFLPYDAADDYVEEGAVLRVQVDGPKPPWDTDRPSLTTDLRVDGGLVELRQGRSADTGEAARLASLLNVELPEGWGPRWAYGSDDAGMDAMRESLERAVSRTDALEAALADADPDDAPGRLYAPRATRWYWFGRESRFALDEHRRAVTTTMPGHHRTKAAHRGASAAVDFAEAVCEPSGPDDAFPFAAVTRQFGPHEGDRVGIGHGKPEGRLITLGRGEVTAYDPDGEITLEREMSPGGSYDALGVRREAGDVAVTKFREGRWWYATIYRDEAGETKGTYVNVCTPLEIFPESVRYVDLHVDVVRYADGTVERVDDDELDEAVEAGHVPEALAEKARDVATRVENAL